MAGETQKNDGIVAVTNPNGASSVVLICEHASRDIPPEFDNLGLSADQRASHIAWDPGALGVALRISDALDAGLVAQTVSRLIYDCNRPPDAPDAMPAKSEAISIPGNKNLTQNDRRERIERYYEPFRARLTDFLATKSATAIVTIHSFTPVYHGKTRAVEIGILHDADARLANAMLESAKSHTQHFVLRNEPYGPEHGVTHTLIEHGGNRGRLNVMIEIRNDLIETDQQQAEIAKLLSGWISDALSDVELAA